MLNKLCLRHVAIIMVAIAGGFVGIFMRMIGDAVPPFATTFYRSFIGFAFLLMLVPAMDRNVFRFSWKDMKGFAIAGLTYSPATLLFITAFKYAPISNVVLLNSTYVLFTSFFAYHFLGEKITKKELTAMGIGLLGLVIINPFASDHLLGNAAALASGFFFGGYLTYLRYEEQKHSIGSSVWILGFTSLVVLPFALYQGVGNVETVWFWIILLGVLCTGLTTLLLTYGLQKVKAENASILLVTCGPLAAIVLSILLVGESLTLRVGIGGALLLCAGVILEWHKKKKRKHHVHHHS